MESYDLSLNSNALDSDNKSNLKTVPMYLLVGLFLLVIKNL